MSDEPQQQGGDPAPRGWSPQGLPADAAAAGEQGAPATDPTAGKKQKKPKRPKRPKRTGWRRAVPTWRMVLGGILLIVLVLIGGFIAGYQLVDIPSANASATAQSNVYLYKDGSVIARDGEVNRENIKLAQVPRTVQHAVLAAEDRNFYSERAVDIKAMIRAGWNTLAGKGKQGGSTITQQYVKNYYLGQEQTIGRKIKEFFIAIKLNREASKNQILEGYLNTSYFGRNAYGIQAAAQAYYNKDIGDITTAQGAYLASLLNAPSAYDVVTHPENKSAAVARWNYVLNGMVKEGWLSAGQRAAMTFPVPGRVKPANSLSGQRGYIVQAVEDYLVQNDILDEKTLATRGYRITTTLEKKKQEALVKAVDDNVMSKTSANREADRNVRVGGASIDPATGRVVAMYGGIDYTKQYVNNATRTDYQVGSTFKPFVFTSAVANDSTTRDGRRITPRTVYDGTNKRMVQGPDGPTGYAPSNEDDISYGPITVTTATDRSVNAVYAQMAQDVGPGKVRQTAVDLGIPKDTPDLTASPSIALGPATASVLDMTDAYATLAGHGKHGPHILVDKVTKDGAAVTIPDRTTKQAVGRQAADTTTSILRSVVDGGTGTAAQGAGRPAAGKTGTAEEDKAAWFAGYTPDLATVIAVMGQDPTTGVQKPLYGALGLPRINGGGAPAETWAQYTGAALRGTPVKNFTLDLESGADDTQLPSKENTTPGNTRQPSRAPSRITPSAPPSLPSPPAFTPSVPESSPATTPPTGGTDTGGSTGGGTGGGTNTGGGGNGGGTTGGGGGGGGTTGSGGGGGGTTGSGGGGGGGGGTTGGLLEGARGSRAPGRL
ncbi:transglycosylase domain-containing protein [Streptomyces sp. NBC_01285]|uniref:transglycosylase domain-containing protein n=1 Tax=Streptomyces sp. NBC_01285 TaxID=2903813 RepID=UPI002254DF06|nr:transglycosylase domain-containing protein [Streptomyces sp. NBC_01285]MCX4772324.1 penicillin-binding protein [Streptomyces sp. NBC_01285]